MERNQMTEIVKGMTLDRAIEVMKNAATMYATEPQTVEAALLKLGTINTLVAPALKEGTAALEKLAKKNNMTIHAEAEVKTKNADGKIVTNVASVTIESIDTAKTELDFESIKTEKGVIIEDDTIDPCVKHVRVGDVATWDLFKAPTLAGNPTAVEAAINKGTLDAKYRTTKTTSKYGTVIDLSPVLENN